MENGIKECSGYLILYVEISYRKLESFLNKNEEFFRIDFKILIDNIEVIQTYTWIGFRNFVPYIRDKYIIHYK